jgi:hypothetical protein
MNTPVEAAAADDGLGSIGYVAEIGDTPAMRGVVGPFDLECTHDNEREMRSPGRPTGPHAGPAASHAGTDNTSTAPADVTATLPIQDDAAAATNTQRSARHHGGPSGHRGRRRRHHRRSGLTTAPNGAE